MPLPRRNFLRAALGLPVVPFVAKATESTPKAEPPVVPAWPGGPIIHSCQVMVIGSAAANARIDGIYFTSP